MRTKAALLTAAVLVAALPPASALGGAEAAANHTVILKNLAYNPSTLRIHRGDTVTWKWEDGSTPHSVTSSRFHGVSARTHGTLKVRFTHAGTFSYHCEVHSFMKGKVIVH